MQILKINLVFGQALWKSRKINPFLQSTKTEFLTPFHNFEQVPRERQKVRSLKDFLPDILSTGFQFMQLFVSDVNSVNPGF